MRVFIYTDTIDGVDVVMEGQNLNPSLTIEESAAKHCGDKPFIIVDDATLPDRDKRDAWVIQDGAVVIDESRIPVLPLSTRLSSLLKQAGQQLASNPNPDDATLQLVDAVMTINGKLKDIAEDFGGDTALYKQAALGYLNVLGVIADPEMEQVRQSMIAECG